MIWLNYNAPGGVTDPATLTEHRAEDGGATLANDIDGLRASRADNPSHLTLIGPSYGSTTAGHAAGDPEIDIDDLVLVGSPGGGYSDVRAYGMAGDNVWAGRNSRPLVGGSEEPKSETQSLMHTSYA